MPPAELALQPDLATLSAWAVYGVVWGFVFVESGLLIGFLLPGDSLLFAAGLVAGTPGSPVNIVVLSIGAFIAAFAGDQLGYLLGRRLGRPWVARRQHPAWTEGLDRAEAFYERYGPVSIVAARFIPWVRTFVPFAAGMAHMDYRRFVVANLVGALLWGVGLTWVGWWAASIPVVRTIAYVVAGVAIATSFAYMAVEGVRALRRRRSDPPDSLEP